MQYLIGESPEFKHVYLVREEDCVSLYVNDKCIAYFSSFGEFVLFKYNDWSITKEKKAVMKITLEQLLEGELK